MRETQSPRVRGKHAATLDGTRKPQEPAIEAVRHTGSEDNAMPHRPEADLSRCRLLVVSDGNILADTPVAAGLRTLMEALARHGMPCTMNCRFLVDADREVEPGPWLAEHGWIADGPTEKPMLHGQRDGVRMMFQRGSSTKRHEPDDAERAELVRAVEAACAEKPPDVLLVCAGPSAAQVLAAGRARGLATVALTDDRVREPAALREADIVVAPTRLLADYLREAFGLPSVALPPVIVDEADTAAPRTPGLVVFDGEAPGHGMVVFAQLAQELARCRPDIPLVMLGGSGTFEFPGGGQVKCVPRSAFRWSEARVLLAPSLDWEAVPLSALTALRHGVPVVASDRGALSQLLDGGALILPLPERLTAPVALPLRPEELAPWLQTIQQLADDAAFAARQRSLATVAGQRWSAEQAVPQYARFFVKLVQARQPQPAPSSNGSAPSSNGAATGLRKLAERFPWPKHRPADAAPGQEQGWLGEGTEIVLARSLTPATRLVVELGAWLGLSTRYIATHAPNATVISVDHWEGSPEHKQQERYRELLPRLFETFQARCWEQRERIVPLRMGTLDGLRAVAAAGLKPDIVYVDAEHSYEAVTAELALARQLFPSAVLVGDDYDWRGVREAADTFARHHGMLVDRHGLRGWRLLEPWQAHTAIQPPPGRHQSMVLVPHMNGIDWECEQALRALEAAGVRVVRRGGCSAIDVARNELASNALHDEAESILFIDSDIGFDPQDALRLLARPEPVISGIYAKKGMRELASIFTDGVKDVLFGPDAVGPYPLRYAATGFLRIRAGVLRRMITELKLPLCNTHWGRGIWPFFQPMIVPHGPDKLHYLGEDWSFSYRLAQIGVTPLADTTIRLWHWGRHGFSWEEAGSTVQRFRSYNYHLT